MSQQTKPTTTTRIILVLESNDDEIQGTGNLARLLGKDKTWVIRSARRLAQSGLISICESCGGRGHRTSYKRNRNQPGIPSLHRGTR